MDEAQTQPDVAEVFQALPQERQKTLLGKMSQEQKNTLYAKLKGNAAPPESTGANIRRRVDTYIGSQHTFEKGKETSKEAPVGERLFRGVASVPIGFGEFGYDVLKDVLKHPEMTPAQQLSHGLTKYIEKPMQEESKKAVHDWDKGDTLSRISAGGHALAGGIPLLGPLAASIGERMGSGDVAGGLGQIAALAAMPEQTKSVLNTTLKALKLDEAGLNIRAAKLAAKNFGDVVDTTKRGKTPGDITVKADVALEPARKGIMSGLAKAGDEIDIVRKKTHAQRLKYYDDATKGGLTLDVSQITKNALDRFKQARSSAGVLDKTTIDELDKVEKQLNNQMLPDGKLVPRDLTKLTPNDFQKLTGQAEGTKGVLSFNEEETTATKNIKNEIREAWLDEADKKMPEAAKMRKSESKLQASRDAVDKSYDQILTDKKATARGILYKGAAPAASYMGLRALGLGGFAGPLLGTIVMYKTLASFVSRQARSVLYLKMNGLVDDAVYATWGRKQGPQGPQMGGTGLTPSPQGNAPVNPANAAVTRGNLPAATGSHAPFAPAEVVYTNVGPPTRGTMLSEKATRAKPGSGDYVKKSVSSVDASKEASAKIENKTNVAQSNIKEAKPAADVSVRNKAMMDRLDTILNTKPTSGAHNVALQREASEIKKILSGEADPKEISKIQKHIADRERIASQRAEATPPAGPAPVSSTGEAVSQAASPEQRAIQLDLGYKGLARFDGGPELVTALKKLAKDMQKADPSYDELEKLKDAVKMLIDIGERPRGDL